MVIEKIIVEIINKLLGNIFENLNRKQLNIGLWSGKVTLTDLYLKESALDNTDLPLKVIRGYLGKLDLLIPWKNIYTQPLVIEAEDLFICVASRGSQPYDAHKEAKKKLEKKLSELARYEEYLLENEEPDLPTFREKLLATAIRNIQIKISNVHFVYEDHMIEGPTIWGINLYNLEIYSTGSDWQKRIYTETLGLSYKIAFIDSLTVYINCKNDSSLVKSLDIYDRTRTEPFKSRKTFPNIYKYIFGPTSTSVKLKIHMMPENDKPPFQSPKIDLMVEENLLEIKISRTQYKYILEFLDTLWRYSLREPYRKYRPFNVHKLGNAKKWWRFVLNSVMDWVRNRRKVWRWEYIIEHRQMCKNYEEAYRKKEVLGKPPQTLLVTLELLEEKLDLFNLLLIRQRVLLTLKQVKTQIELETARRNQTGWFGNILPGNWFAEKKELREEEIGGLLRKFKQELTKTEKEKLFNAIGYPNSNTPMYVPENYASVLLYAHLKELKISFHAKTKIKSVLTEVACLSIKRIAGEFHYRPTTNSCLFSASLGDLKITGTPRREHTPSIVECSHRAKSNLLEITYELNPLDKSCDHRLFFLSRSLQCIYDSKTFLNVFNAFIIYDDYFKGCKLSLVPLKKSPGITYSTLKLIHESSATFDFYIEIMSNVIIVPSNGFYIPNESFLILISLGKAIIKLKPREKLSLSDVDYSDKLEKIQEKILKAAYNYCHITTSHTQMLVVFPGESWKTAVFNNLHGEMHVLKPTSVISKLGFCTLKKNRYLPEVTLNVEILALEFHLAEKRVLRMLDMLYNISYPKFESKNYAYLNNAEDEAVVYYKRTRVHSLYTMFKGNFKLNKFYVQYSSALGETSAENLSLLSLSSNTESGTYTKDQTLTIQVLGTNLKIRQSTEAFILKLFLDSIQLVQQARFDSPDSGINILDTFDRKDDESLLTILYVKANEECDAFLYRYKSTSNLIKVIILPLELKVHLEYFLNLLEIANHVKEKIIKIFSQRTRKFNKTLFFIEENMVTNFIKRPTYRHSYENDSMLKALSIELKFVAAIENFRIVLVTKHHTLAAIELLSINLDVIKKLLSLEINGQLKRINIKDLTGLSIHKTVLDTLDEDAINFNIVFLELFDKSDKTKDEMVVFLEIGCIKFIYLVRFLNGCLCFFRHFQLPIKLFTEAYDAAADAATVIYDEAMRIKCQINLKAPIIIIPIDSESLNSIELNLGSLNVSNSVSAMIMENNTKIWIDTIRIDLKNLTIKNVHLLDDSMVTVAYDKKTNGLENILNPTSCFVFVTRNLSKKRDSNIADIQVNGALHTIECHLLQRDFQTVKSILLGNFQETSTDICLPPAVDSYMPQKRRTDFKSVLQKRSEDVYIFFEVDGFVIYLIESSSEIMARVALYLLSIQISNFNNGDFNLNLDLCSVEIKDMRKNVKNVIFHYVIRKDSEIILDGDAKTMNFLRICKTGNITPMISLGISMKQSYTTVEFNIISFDFIINVQFYDKIVKFITISEKKHKKLKAYVQSRIHSEAEMKNIRASRSDFTINEHFSGSRLNIICKVNSPNIILVESLEDLNTKAIILTVNAFFDYHKTLAYANFNGSFEDFCMYMCIFNPELRENSTHYILKPCRVICEGSTDINKYISLKFIFSELNLNLSPSSVELLLKAINILSSPPENKEEINEVTEDLSKLWIAKQCKEKEFWFLNVENIYSVIEDPGNLDSESDLESGEIVFEFSKISIIIETGEGYYTTPIILFWIGSNITILLSTHSINIKGKIEVITDYYNRQNGVWEPVIEILENVNPNGTVHLSPWAVHFNALCKTHQIEINHQLTSKKTINCEIYSDHIMEITLSKAFLELCSNISKDFSDAVYEKGLHKPKIITAYKIINNTGQNITLDVDFGILTFHEVYFSQKAQQIENVIIEKNKRGKTLCHLNSNGYVHLIVRKNVRKENLNDEAYTVGIKIESTTEEILMPISNVQEVYYTCIESSTGIDWDFICEIVNEYGTLTVKLHSIVSIANFLTEAVSVYQKENRLDVSGFKVLRVESNEKKYLPIKATYNNYNDLFFELEGYALSNEGIKWNENVKQNEEYSRVITCLNKQNSEPIFINVIREHRAIPYGHMKFIKMFVYNIMLRPLIYIRNALPLKLTISIAELNVSIKEGKNQQSKFSSHRGVLKILAGFGEKEVKPGELQQIPSLAFSEPSKKSQYFLIVKLQNYLAKEWSCSTQVENRKYTTFWNFSTADFSTHEDLDLPALYEDYRGSLHITLYSAVWMINKTGLNLSYGFQPKKAKSLMRILQSPPNYKGPLFFSFHPDLQKKKRFALLRVGDGSWQVKVPLDTPGSSGDVTCEEGMDVFRIGVHNHLRQGSQTKKILFFPYFIVFNKCKYPIEVIQLQKQNQSILIEPGSHTGLWPQRNSDHKIFLRIDGVETVPFKYANENKFLLKLEGHYIGGIYVSIHSTEGGVCVTLTGYQNGNAPALMINNSSYTISYRQIGFKDMYLKRNQCQMFAWQNPQTDHLFLFGNCEQSITLDRNTYGFFLIHNGIKIYWSTFLDGPQRIMLFTHSEYESQKFKQDHYLQKYSSSFQLRLEGIGISLVNNRTTTEVCYFGVTRTDFLWEYQKTKNDKFHKIIRMSEMERLYQEHLSKKGPDQNKILNFRKNWKVDFQNMKIRTKKVEYLLKRSFEPGIKIVYSFTEFNRQLSVILQRVQIDNQLIDPVYPVVLAPIVPPQSVLHSSLPPPLIKFLIIEEVTPNTDIKLYKHIGLYINEFDIKVSVRFLMELAEIFSESKDEVDQLWLEKDLNTLEKSVNELVKVGAFSEVRNYIHHVHFSPIKVHLSFTIEDSRMKPKLGIFTLLYALGVAVTNINDVVFRLNLFKRENIVSDKGELMWKLLQHYKGQAIKQFYVLALGLDVLGNPYGLLFGFKRGLEDLLFEPFRGASRGPGEFCEGVYYGVRSLFGYTIGGFAGALSRLGCELKFKYEFNGTLNCNNYLRITGSIGRGFAMLTFDAHYLRIRRNAKISRPRNILVGIIRNSLILVMTFVDGIRGIVLLPLAGLREEHFKGFILGLLKGMLGTVTRPTSGIFDFISYLLDNIKRLLSVRDEPSNLRITRYMHRDKIIRSYSLAKSKGYRILTEIRNGRFLKTDTFVHCEILSPMDCFILTNQHVIYASRKEFFNFWIVRWCYKIADVVFFVQKRNGIEATAIEKQCGKKIAKVKFIQLDEKRAEAVMEMFISRDYEYSQSLKLLRDTKYGTYL